MEELWKDMATLSSTHHHPHPQTTIHQTPLYEFLASPISQSSDDLKSLPKNATFQDCPSRLGSQGFGTCLCSSYMPSLSLRKSGVDYDNGGIDQRYKRKMKNRESATRSRARRQAYTTELEIEVAQLREENAMLRKRQEEMSTAAAVALTTHVPKKSKLPRSFTAPF